MPKKESPVRKISELEDLLKDVRACLEAKTRIKIRRKIRLTDGSEPVLFDAPTKYKGSYVMNDKIVVMVTFDDSKVAPDFTDMSCGLIRRIVKDLVVKEVPVLDRSEVRIHITDTSTDTTDFEDDKQDD